ncbi:hypothetical protein [Micromonospora tulbaghiae]|uniref:hypothetical protein n=1 Tax=Micromonospora tulbaghiae TaxID=479978 RepID=UPI00368796D9
MVARDETERSLIASLASNTYWANCPDRAAHTAPGRRAAMARFERQVDPDGTLPPDERARRAESARKAYFAKLALKSAQVRRANAAARKTGRGEAA